MSQEAYILLTVLTLVLSLVILGLTLFDMFRIRRQRLYVRWLLKEAMESISKAEAAETSVDEWQMLRALVFRQRSRVHKMLWK
jgi:hypothetical protein